MNKRFYFGFLVVLSLFMTLALAACGGDSNPTATTAPSTTVAATTAATTVAATTAATTKASTTAAATTAPATSTTVAATTAAATKTAAATTAATTAAATGNKSAIVPADGTFDGDLAVLGKVLKASNEYSSLKMVLTSSEASVLSGTVIVVKPENISVDLNSSGKRQLVIALGKDVYVSTDGTSWTKTDASAFNAQQLIGSLNQGSVDQIKKLAGSTFSLKPDEKLDGKDVGVMEIDTSTSTSADAQQLMGGKLLYKYDKQSFRLVQVIVKTSVIDLDTRYLDYDSPTNKVEAPKL